MILRARSIRGFLLNRDINVGIVRSQWLFHVARKNLHFSTNRESEAEKTRLEKTRNIGIIAHIDAVGCKFYFGRYWN